MTLKLGLLSTAKINSEILRSARDLDTVAIAAVASRDGARAQAYAHEHGIGRSHSSYDALLADDGIDAIYVSLPNGLHHEWTLRALDAGKHVLCEKPYSGRPSDVEDAWDAAEKAGLVLMEAFMYRHHPQTLRMRELVESGALGQLRTVKTTFSFPLADLSDVRGQPELGGGALMDVGSYCVSGARLLAGEPLRVQGEQVTASTGIDLSVHGQLRHADDVVSQIEASFDAPRRQRLEAIGTDATLVVEAPWRVDWGGAISLTRGEEVERIEIEPADSYRLELENFADAVAGRAEPLLGREDALGQARTIEALYRAAASGESVTLVS